MPRDKPQSETNQPTDAERDERILMCRRLLGQGQYDGQVKKAVAAHYNLSPRTVERYLRRARDQIVKETGMEPVEHRANSYNFYVEMVSNREARNQDRIRARERIDKLLGLEAPTKLQHSGDQNQPIRLVEFLSSGPAVNGSQRNGHVLGTHQKDE